jgi:hypothetical protein
MSGVNVLILFSICSDFRTGTGRTLGYILSDRLFLLFSYFVLLHLSGNEECIY